MGRRSSDLTGRVFGLLEVLGPDESSKDRRWICKCKCGNSSELSLSSRYLMNGKYHHCGCIIKSSTPSITSYELEDLYINRKLNIKQIAEYTGLHQNTISKYLAEYGLKGKKYDVLSRSNLYNLYVLKRYSISTISRDNNISRSIISDYINKYNLKYERIICTKSISKRKITGRKPSALIGRRFGRLTVTEYLGNGKTVLCTCDCGESVETDVGSLYSYRTASCGCKEMSIASLRIEEYLSKHNVQFSMNYKVNNSISFEFAIYNNGVIDSFIMIAKKYPGRRKTVADRYCDDNNINLIKMKYQSKGKIYEILGKEIAHLIGV